VRRLVRYIVEGSVRRVDDRIHVSARLIDTASGEDVWSDSCEGDIDKDLEATKRALLLTQRAMNSCAMPVWSESTQPQLPARADSNQLRKTHGPVVLGPPKSGS
jgi:TolB-like protein